MEMSIRSRWPNYHNNTNRTPTSQQRRPESDATWLKSQADVAECMERDHERPECGSNIRDLFQNALYGTEVSDDDSHITDPVCVHNRPDGLENVAEEKGNQVCREVRTDEEVRMLVVLPRPSIER